MEQMVIIANKIEDIINVMTTQVKLIKNLKMYFDENNINMESFFINYIIRLSTSTSYDGRNEWAVLTARKMVDNSKIEYIQDTEIITLVDIICNKMHRYLQQELFKLMFCGEIKEEYPTIKGLVEEYNKNNYVIYCGKLIPYMEYKMQYC